MEQAEVESGASGLEGRAITALKAVGHNTERVGLLRRERNSREGDD
ncbi:hypothetical protein ACFWF9_21990 [Streptomyces roseolus]